jgi:hypothetical protein
VLLEANDIAISSAMACGELGMIVDVRVCGWVMWEWVAAQPGVAVLLEANDRR